MIKISVIVPIYNIENYLDRCLRSLINQTYKNIEIILINDGSKDSSLKICEKYKKTDERIQIITQTNKGLSEARNTGIKYAQGDYISFVDGDDWLNRDCFENCIKFLDNSVDILMFSYIREYGNKSVPTLVFENSYLEWKGKEIETGLIRRLIGPVGEELERPNRMEDLNPVWNKIYKSDILKEKKFVDTKIIGTEDLWFNLTAFSEAQKIIFIKDFYYHYNKENGSSLTRKYNQNLFIGWKTLYSYIRLYINEQNLNRKIYSDALNNRIIINLLALSRNVVISDLKYTQKMKELKNILNDALYQEVFQKFEFHSLSNKWKVFYYCCYKKRAGLLYLLLLAGEKMKKYAK